MRVLPTMEGGLRVDLEEETDWMVLETLVEEARGKGDGWLARRLGVLMEDEDWDEYVVPDLAQHFGLQVEVVEGALKKARSESKEERGELFIGPGQGEAWYGVLNQARLAIEEEWKFGGEEENLDFSKEEPAKLAALMRSRLYMLLQSHLLEFVLDSGDGGA